MVWTRNYFSVLNLLLLRFFKITFQYIKKQKLFLVMKIFLLVTKNLEKKLQNPTNLLIIASQRSTSCEILLILKFLLKQGLSTRRPRRRPLLLLWDLIALQLLLPAPKSKKKVYILKSVIPNILPLNLTAGFHFSVTIRNFKKLQYRRLKAIKKI